MCNDIKAAEDEAVLKQQKSILLEQRTQVAHSDGQARTMRDATSNVPKIIGMRKFGHPDIWGVTLEGCERPLVLWTAELLSYSRFRRKASVNLNRLYGPMREVEWCRLVDRAMGKFLRREVFP